ncbi:hypothetical protein Tco_1192184 [Tanacetum coccineum]
MMDEASIFSNSGEYSLLSAKAMVFRLGLALGKFLWRLGCLRLVHLVCGKRFGLWFLVLNHVHDNYEVDPSYVAKRQLVIRDVVRQTRSVRQDPTTRYSEPERFIHQTLRKKKKRNSFIPIEDQVPKAKYPPFENLFEAEVVYNPFLDLHFPMVDDQPMWGNNRAVAPTPGAVIIAVDLGDNFTIKGHHLSMIKDRQFNGRSRADPHKHIAEFIKMCGMFCYGDDIK